MSTYEVKGHGSHGWKREWFTEKQLKFMDEQDGKKGAHWHSTNGEGKFWKINKEDTEIRKWCNEHLKLNLLTPDEADKRMDEMLSKQGGGMSRGDTMAVAAEGPALVRESTRAFVAEPVAAAPEGRKTRSGAKAEAVMALAAKKPPPPAGALLADLGKKLAGKRAELDASAKVAVGAKSDERVKANEEAEKKSVPKEQEKNDPPKVTKSRDSDFVKGLQQISAVRPPPSQAGSTASGWSDRAEPVQKEPITTEKMAEIGAAIWGRSIPPKPPPPPPASTGGMLWGAARATVGALAYVASAAVGMGAHDNQGAASLADDSSIGQDNQPISPNESSSAVGTRGMLSAEPIASSMSLSRVDSRFSPSTIRHHVGPNSPPTPLGRGGEESSMPHLALNDYTTSSRYPLRDAHSLDDGSNQRSYLQYGVVSDDLKKQVGDLTEEMLRLSMQHQYEKNTLEAEIDLLKEENATLKTKADRLDELVAKYNRLVNSFNDQRTEIATHEQEVERLGNEIQHWRGEWFKADTFLKAEQQKVADLTQDLHRQKGFNPSGGNTARVQADLNIVREQLRESEAVRQVDKERHRQVMELGQKVLGERNQEIAQLKTQLNARPAGVPPLSVNVAAMQAELDQAKKDLAQTRDDLQRSQLARASAPVITPGVQAELDEGRKAKVELARCQKLNGELQAELRKTQNELMAFKFSPSAPPPDSAVVTRLQGELDRVVANYRATHDEYTKKKQELEAAQSKIKSLESTSLSRSVSFAPSHVSVHSSVPSMMRAPSMSSSSQSELHVELQVLQGKYNTLLDAHNDLQKKTGTRSGTVPAGASARVNAALAKEAAKTSKGASASSSWR